MQNGIESINYEHSMNIEKNEDYKEGFHDALCKVLEELHKREDDTGFRDSRDKLLPYVTMRYAIYDIYKQYL